MQIKKDKNVVSIEYARGRPTVIDTLCVENVSSVQLEQEDKHRYWFCINYKDGESLNLYFKNLGGKGPGIALEHVSSPI